MKKVFIWIVACFMTFQAIPANAEDPGAIVVTVSGIKVKRGETLQIMLYANDKDYSSDTTDFRKMELLGSDENTHTFILENVPLGEYMIVGVQDTNKNGELDSNFIGIPSEGYFTSNNIRVPSWKKCSFFYEGTALRLPLKMIYW